MKHASFFAALTGAALLAACTTAPDETPLAAPMAPEVEAEAETAAPAYDEAFPPAIEEISFDSHGDRLNGLVYVADGPGPHPANVIKGPYSEGSRDHIRRLLLKATTAR